MVTRSECQPGCKRIRLAWIYIPTILIRLSTMKSRSLKLQWTSSKTDRDDTIGNVRGVLLVMTQSRDWIFGCGRPVRIGRRAESGFSNGPPIYEQLGLLVELEIVPPCNLHEEFVGMLSINNWQPVSRFSQLEKLRIPSLRDGGRFEAQHCSERNRIPAVLTRERRHQPIR